MIIRYVVRMRNGDYMVQDVDEMIPMRININTRDNPVDADLFRTRENAQRCIDETLSGNTNLLVLYNNENPPQEIVEIEINYQLIRS